MPFTDLHIEVTSKSVNFERERERPDTTLKPFDFLWYLFEDYPGGGGLFSN